MRLIRWLRCRKTAVLLIVLASVQPLFLAWVVTSFQGAAQVPAQCHKAASVALWGSAASCEHWLGAAPAVRAVFAIAVWCALDLLVLAGLASRWLAARMCYGTATRRGPS